MSAVPQLQHSRDHATSSRPRLRGLPRPARDPQLRPFWFIVIAMVVVVGAVAGQLALNTRIQDQAFTVNQLSYEARSTGDTEAKLQADVEAQTSTTQLMDRATTLGMVPAGRVGYLLLDQRKVVGDPKPITGAELPRYRTAAQQAADAKAAEAKRKADEEAAKKKAEEAEAKKKADEEAAKKKAADDAKASASPSAPASSPSTDASHGDH